jgi:uncharacterized protein
MKIAVIGGGAAGLASAHYLARKYDVELFERQNTLGGNIRTLGKNAERGLLPDGITIDNGVIEFLRDQSPHLTSLLSELGVQSESMSHGSSGLFLEDGRHFHFPGAIRRSGNLMQQLSGYWKLATLLPHLPLILLRMLGNRSNRFGDVLGHDYLSNWMRMLTMYGFSMPYSTMSQFPLDLAKGALQRGRPGVYWMRIPGGVYSYLQAIVDRGEIEISTAVHDLQVVRRNRDVILRVDGKEIQFDHVVFATPPHEVLDLIEEPTSLEKRLFSGWQGNHIQTIIHTDASVYKRWNPSEMTEFDVFEKEAGEDAGYNAYLNRLSGLPGQSPHYFLAFNMLDRIDPALIIQRQSHTTTWFTAENSRHDIRSLNGVNHTWFAGAWLCDGLQEGAIESAVHVARGLGIRI